MPFVTIRVTDEGVTADQKRELVARVTRALSQVLNKKPASTLVVVEEVGTDNWGVEGIQTTERRRLGL